VAVLFWAPQAKKKAEQAAEKAKKEAEKVF
jgi:hypothetical protein